MEQAELQIILKQLKHIPPAEMAGLLREINKIAALEEIQEAREHFLPFVKKMWPAFIEGSHLRIMIEAFERVVKGDLKRLMIHMGPRHGKSMLTSYLLPAWFIGKNPEKKIIQASHTAELCVGFGRQVRNLLNHPDYKAVFPGVSLRADSKAAGRWDTNKGGEYFAIGTGGGITGKGADLMLIDDPHNEQQAKSGDPSVFDDAYDWYVTGPRQRLQPSAAIVVVATRWSKRDLPARLMRAAANDPLADQWEVIEFPAIMPDGRALWPEFWSIKELLATKASMPPHWWQAAYQQNPTSGETALVKAEWWKVWEGPPPKCSYIIQSWDTSYGKNDRANPSACTTWGLFEHSTTIQRTTPLKGQVSVSDSRRHIILLDSFAERLDFPKLKTRAMAEYQRFKPDCVIIEAKASGTPLITELRLAGLPIEEYSPQRGNDKTVRVNAVTDMFQAGMIWAPDARYANEVKMQFADFPAGEFDDLVDSSTQALLRIRQGGLIRLHSDFGDDEEEKPRRRIANYY